MKTPLQQKKNKERLKIFNEGGSFKEMADKCNICETAYIKWAQNNNLVKERPRRNYHNKYNDTLIKFEVLFFKGIKENLIQTPKDIGQYFKGWNENNN